FLKRCEAGELRGVTTVNVILEVLHRLLMIEAVTKGLVSQGNVARKLKEKPDVVGQLKDYYTNTDKIGKMGVEIESLTYDVVQAGQEIREKYGLLVNDSLIAAFVMTRGLKNLATNDGDFKRVRGLSVFMPEDVPA
ncbi:uncharacterized protein HKBW3S25_00565, partial [Candidatus Hakubella thermalkaliphila]